MFDLVGRSPSRSNNMWKKVFSVEKCVSNGISSRGLRKYFESFYIATEIIQESSLTCFEILNK